VELIIGHEDIGRPVVVSLLIQILQGGCAGMFHPINHLTYISKCKRPREIDYLMPLAVARSYVSASGPSSPPPCHTGKVTVLFRPTLKIRFPYVSAASP